MHLQVIINVKKLQFIYKL